MVSSHQTAYKPDGVDSVESSWIMLQYMKHLQSQEMRPSKSWKGNKRAVYINSKVLAVVVWQKSSKGDYIKYLYIPPTAILLFFTSCPKTLVLLALSKAVMAHFMGG